MFWETSLFEVEANLFGFIICCFNITGSPWMSCIIGRVCQTLHIINDTSLWLTYSIQLDLYNNAEL